MANTTSSKLLTYQFNDHRQLVRATIAGNIIMALIFLLADPDFLWQNKHVQLTLFSALIVLSLALVYDWKKVIGNWLVVLIYLGVFVLEMILVGIPDLPIPPSQKVGKGMLLDLFLGLSPYVYVGVRLILVIPLIQLSLTSLKISQYE